jgi:hypothetical protein
MLLPTSNDKWGVRENDPISLKLFGDSRDRFWHEVEALKIVENRLSCALCSAIWKSFTISNGNVPPPTELDGKRLRVRSLVMPYAYWFPGYSYSGECAIQRLSIILYRPLGLADCYEEDPLREPILTNFFAFQACENSPLNVSEVCDLNGAQLTSNRISFGGRLRPLKADLRLISWWIKVCLQKHKSTCQQPPVVSPSRKELNLRVIDIEQGCIAEAPFESNFIYIALSYVWGDSHCLDLLTSNENFLTKPGSLNSQRLPATYSDLTQLSLELGCRYVWIDRLCIRQDDQEDLSKYLSIMDEIYGSAFLTVIAASGKNVHAGLPGIRPGTRHRVQDIVPVWRTMTDAYLNSGQHFQTERHLTLMNTLRPQKLRDDDILSDTIWDKRAWCMQERVLSRRNLIFTDEQIYWECQGGSFCEESEFDFWQDRTFRYAEQPSLVGLRPRDTSSEGDSRAGPSTYWVDTPSGKELKPLPRLDGLWEQYYRLVLQYSRRQLSFQDDCFNAFRGILQHLSKVSGEEFFWAMPRSYFERSLIWSGSTDRRLAFYPSADGKGKCCFPSWSWISWYQHVWLPIPVGDEAIVPRINPVKYKIASPDQLKAPDTAKHCSEIHCWMLEDGSLTLVRDGPVTEPKSTGSQFNQRSNLNARSELRPWKPERNPTTAFEFSRSSMHDDGALILFWTSLARFTIRFDPDSIDENQSGFDEHGRAVCKLTIPLIVDEENRVVGRMSSQLERSWKAMHKDSQQECDLIVICSFDDPDNSKVKMLDVMEIGWIRDIAYRINVGHIAEEAWMATSREWRIIALA